MERSARDQAIIVELAAHRDLFANAQANSQGEIAALKEEIKELKAKIAKYESEDKVAVE